MKRLTLAAETFVVEYAYYRENFPGEVKEISEDFGVSVMHPNGKNWK